MNEALNAKLAQIKYFQGPIENLPTFKYTINNLYQKYGIKVIRSDRLLRRMSTPNKIVKAAYVPPTKTIIYGKHTLVGDFFHELVHFKYHSELKFKPLNRLEYLKSELKAYTYESKNRKLFGYSEWDVQIIEKRIRQYTQEIKRVMSK